MKTDNPMSESMRAFRDSVTEIEGVFGRESSRARGFNWKILVTFSGNDFEEKSFCYSSEGVEYGLSSGAEFTLPRG